MARPQQPELRRSDNVAALNPDSTQGELEAHRRPGAGGRTGPVPEENLPGHHPEHEEDKPDPRAFVARMAGRGRTRSRPSAPEATPEAAPRPADMTPEPVTDRDEHPLVRLAGLWPRTVRRGLESVRRRL